MPGDMDINQLDRFGPAYAANFKAEGKDIAFIAVYHGHEGHGGPGIGIAVANDEGFHPIPKYIFSCQTMVQAQEIADSLNETVLALSKEQYVGIVCSSMGGRHYEGEGK